MLKFRNILILCALPLLLTLTCSEKLIYTKQALLYIGFYNLDNLYDTIRDIRVNDIDFTPNGKYNWNTERYQSKLKNLSKVIVNMNGLNSPDVLGLCELENRQVLDDLIEACHFDSQYKIFHVDSEDERGSDVGLIYNAQKLKMIDSFACQVVLSKNINDKTRDILWVKLVTLISNDTFQIMVCHFPSRKEGQKLSEPNRVDAAKFCKQIIEERCNLNTQNLIVMGDFNDEPWDKSIAHILGASKPSISKQTGLNNLMFGFKEKGLGTYRYRSYWNVLDQFMLSSALLNNDTPDYLENSVKIKKEKWMIQTGKFKGYPLRTFGGNNWLNGYSDHLPITMTIQLKTDG